MRVKYYGRGYKPQHIYVGGGTLGADPAADAQAAKHEELWNAEPKTPAEPSAADITRLLQAASQAIPPVGAPQGVPTIPVQPGSDKGWDTSTKVILGVLVALGVIGWGLVIYWLARGAQNQRRA